MNNFIKKIAETKLLKLTEKLKNSPKIEEFPNNWIDIAKLVKSSEVPAPIFTSKNDLGHKLLNSAMEKRAREISQEIDIPVREVIEKIWAELKNNRVSRISSISTIRFFRDIDADIFLECDECGFINTPDWENCKNCGKKND